MVTTTKHGEWVSPIDARSVAGHDGMPTWASICPDGAVWWCEPRPTEGGRVALVRRVGQGPVETVLPAPWSCRSRVHEYGGRSYRVLPDGSVVFADFADQRLYRMVVGADPVPITPQPSRPSGLRYVEPFVPPAGDELWCIREEHHSDRPTDVSREIVAVPLDGSAADAPGAVRTVVEDRHFLACPEVSPDGSRLSWIAWDHPRMPWDGTELRVADLAAGTATGLRTLAGGPDESVAQASWLDPSTLLAATDRTGWWNLLRIDATSGRAEEVLPREEEFGGPLWQLGYRWFAPLADGRVATLHGSGPFRLGLLDLGSGELTDVETPHTEWSGMLQAAGECVVGVAGAPDRSSEVVGVDPAGGGWAAVSDSEPSPFAADLPVPGARLFHASDGREVHAHVYPPSNAQHATPEGEPAPYLVFAHGGPTSRVAMVEDLEIAYFTSRGLGVVEVNYGGSTGYGRAYRNRLREQWGVVDVEDCVAVALALVAEGSADPERLAIRGGSAGGWTAAAALTSSDVFACAAIAYPIIELETWQEAGTHDFESQYLQSLVGPWPEERQRYVDRAPVTNADRLTTPFLLTQGLDDVICPPAQAERFLEQAAARGVPHAYLTFEGEQHGFRKASTIIAALEAELSLYGQVFGFDPPGVPRLELRP